MEAPCTLLEEYSCLKNTESKWAAHTVFSHHDITRFLSPPRPHIQHTPILEGFSTCWTPFGGLMAPAFRATPRRLGSSPSLSAAEKPSVLEAHGAPASERSPSSESGATQKATAWFSGLSRQEWSGHAQTWFCIPTWSKPQSQVPELRK